MLVPLWKGHEVDKVRVAYRTYWKRWVGAPVRALTDGGPEFGEAFTSAMQQDGTWHEVTAAVPVSKWKVEEIIDQVTNAHNTMVRKDAYSPNQRVLGAEVRVPSMLTCGGRDEAVGSVLAVGEPVEGDLVYVSRRCVRELKPHWACAWSCWRKSVGSTWS